MNLRRAPATDRFEHPRGKIVLERDMPGGNGEWVAPGGDGFALVIRPEIRGGSPHRGWFFVRLRDLAPGQAYTIRVVENCWAGVYSHCYDIGEAWHHFTEYRKDNDTDYTFFFRPERDTLHLAMMPPYFQEHLERLIAQTAAAETLCVRDFWTSEAGHSGILFELGNPAASSRVWITARMHAFEAVSSWVADGLIRWALSADPEARWLVENVRLCVVPMVDVDSVQGGSSGKHRTPICFARDARPNPHWNAIKALVQEWERQGPPDLFLDLHGPGGRETDIYFYAPEQALATPAYERDLEEFGSLLAATVPAAMRYERRVFRCPLGPDDQGQDMAGVSYFYLHQRYFGKSRLRLALGLETPWSVPGYTVDVFLECGAAYGQAISRFLRRQRGTER